jgi:hypothetical protein
MSRPGSEIATEAKQRIDLACHGGARPRRATYYTAVIYFRKGMAGEHDLNGEQRPTVSADKSIAVGPPSQHVRYASGPPRAETAPRPGKVVSGVPRSVNARSIRANIRSTIRPCNCRCAGWRGDGGSHGAACPGKTALDARGCSIGRFHPSRFSYPDEGSDRSSQQSHRRDRLRRSGQTR